MSTANLSFNVQHPKGFVATLSLETESLKDAVEKFEALVPILENKGWTPVEASYSQGQERSNDVNGDKPPVCPTHNKPMKRSKFGEEWYCPVRIAPDDGTGKPVYCKQKA